MTVQAKSCPTSVNNIRRIYKRDRMRGRAKSSQCFQSISVDKRELLSQRMNGLDTLGEGFWIPARVDTFAVFSKLEPPRSRRDDSAARDAIQKKTAKRA